MHIIKDNILYLNFEQKKIGFLNKKFFKKLKRKIKKLKENYKFWKKFPK